MRIKSKCLICGADPPVKGTPKEIWQYCQQHPHCHCGGVWELISMPRETMTIQVHIPQQKRITKPKRAVYISDMLNDNVQAPQRVNEPIHNAIQINILDLISSNLIREANQDEN